MYLGNQADRRLSTRSVRYPGNTHGLFKQLVQTTAVFFRPVEFNKLNSFQWLANIAFSGLPFITPSNERNLLVPIQITHLTCVPRPCL